VGDDAGEVALLNARGRPLWRYDLGSRVTALNCGWHRCILAGGWDERLSCLNTEADGERVRWQAKLDGPVSDIATLADLALVATLNGDITAHAPDGSELWQFDAGASVSRLGTVVGAGESLVLVGLQTGHLLALDPDGSERWRLELHAEAQGAPVWHVADVVEGPRPELAVGMGGALPLLALVSPEGDLLWRVAVPSAVGAITTADLNGDGDVEILTGLASGEIQAYDTSGRHRGSSHAGLSVWGLQAAEDGSVLVLADVVAWRLAGSRGLAGSAWLDPPDTLPVKQTLVPPVAGDPASPHAGEPGSPDTEEPGSPDALVDLEGPDRPLIASGEATLVFLGDVALGRSMEAQLARYGPAYPWAGLGPLLADADLSVANLECVLSDQGQSLDKPYIIRSHPRWGQSLAEAGFDLVTLANNHALDYGAEGLDETLDTLRDLGIASVGAGRTAAQAHQPAHFTVNGVRIAVLGYAAARWYDSQDVPATDRLAWAEPHVVQADVRAVRDQVDFVVVLLHAGTEYATKPSSDQVAVARAAMRAGADLVVGHHPHVTQTVEQVRGGLIVYSLGDALFDIPRQAAMLGHLLRVHVTREGLAQAELWPFWIGDSIQPRLLDNGEGAPRVRVVYP
jgi:poly-gamma-glutamate synthesis protein (capsule biosynthesis protein)